MVNPLAVPDDLATWRDADDDTQAIEAAQALVRGYCGWHIAPSVTETITLDGPGPHTAYAFLPTLYLTAVADLEVDSEAVDLDDDLMSWSEAGFLFRVQGWTWRRRGITVTITHGYRDVPGDVMAVVLELADSLASTISGATAVRIDDASVEYGPNRLSDIHRGVLDRYRIPQC